LNSSRFSGVSVLPELDVELEVSDPGDEVEVFLLEELVVDEVLLRDVLESVDEV